MEESTLKKANEIMIRFVSDTEAKVRYGLRQRQEFHESMEKGTAIRNYRSEYILKLTYEIFGWFAEKAEEFAAQYPQDRITTEDLKDILVTAHGRLMAREKEKK